jgi:hypothetical protein
MVIAGWITWIAGNDLHLIGWWCLRSVIGD